jgi:hypothetical protein
MALMHRWRHAVMHGSRIHTRHVLVKERVLGTLASLWSACGAITVLHTSQ